ncbi:MAG: LAGLIDADG family homing endonuclease, partial [Candidatus Margulisbacteria bacterium]|nr:LAGLIDADG family homing endonuclease [Candidatus Margulisiibacteriota bacterium]
MKNPWYITGLCDGEGCFSVSFNLRSKLKTGIEVRPSFSVSLNKRDLEIIQDLEKYFG